MYRRFGHPGWATVGAIGAGRQVKAKVRWMSHYQAQRLAARASMLPSPWSSSVVGED